MKFWVLVLITLTALPAAAQYRRTLADVPDQVICLTWNKREFVYHVDLEGSPWTPGDTELLAVDAAFATWQGVSNDCSDFSFTPGEQYESVVVGSGTANENVVVWRETSCDEVVPQGDPCRDDKNSNACTNQYRCWDHDESTIALTTTTYSKSTGAIYDSDIELNGVNFKFTTVSSPPCRGGALNADCVASDIQNTLTHEIGHAVGFDHVSAIGSTMAASAEIGEISKRQIDYGSVEGFCTTYPRGGPPAPCDEPALTRRRVTARQAGTPPPKVSCSTGLGPLEWLGVGLGCRWLLRRRRANFFKLS